MWWDFKRGLGVGIRALRGCGGVRPPNVPHMLTTATIGSKLTHSSNAVNPRRSICCFQTSCAPVDNSKPVTGCIAPTLRRSPAFSYVCYHKLSEFGQFLVMSSMSKPFEHTSGPVAPQIPRRMQRDLKFKYHLLCSAISLLAILVWQ